MAGGRSAGDAVGSFCRSFVSTGNGLALSRANPAPASLRGTSSPLHAPGHGRSSSPHEVDSRDSGGPSSAGGGDGIELVAAAGHLLPEEHPRLVAESALRFFENAVCD